MEIEYYVKNVFGTPTEYILNADTANAVRNISGQKTLTPNTRYGLEKLGFTFKEVIAPR